ncbi:MAG: erythromycin esterase family protein [Thermoanaerobaculia bacterium]
MRQLAAVFLLALTALPASGAPAPARPFLDLGFEAPECSSNWQEDGRGPYRIAIDGTQALSGRQSLEIRYETLIPWNGVWSGIVTQELPAALFAGKRVHIGGAIRTEKVGPGRAGLWLNALRSNGTVVRADLAGQGPAGTKPWTRYELAVTIPPDAEEISFGGNLAGVGVAWFDDFTIEIDGRPWTETVPAMPPPTQQAVSWLRGHALPFSTVEAENGFADLQPLKKVIGDAHIVSLGEQTHGTREFFQMKHRLLEFLASEMGFTLFSIEANMPEAYRLNEYVLTGQGNPRDLLKGMYFWTWNTQEVLDMIEWMRRFNQSGKGRVQFTGFDMQYVVVSNRVVRDFLSLADPGFSLEASPLLQRMENAFFQRRATAEDIAAAREVFGHLSSRRGEYLARYSREKVDWAIQNARIGVQNMELWAGGLRDESMAENVDWILEQNPGARIVLWAHNGHVSRSPGAMGSYLGARHGKDMVVLGFAFGEGRYNAVRDAFGVIEWDALPPPANSVESFLASPGIPRFILDLRRVPAGGAGAWLRKPKQFRAIGALVARCGMYPHVVTNYFDGLIWIDRTTPSVLLP